VRLLCLVHCSHLSTSTLAAVRLVPLLVGVYNNMLASVCWDLALCAAYGCLDTLLTPSSRHEAFHSQLMPGEYLPCPSAQQLPFCRQPRMQPAASCVKQKGAAVEGPPAMGPSLQLSTDRRRERPLPWQRGHPGQGILTPPAKYQVDRTTRSEVMGIFCKQCN